MLFLGIISWKGASRFNGRVCFSDEGGFNRYSLKKQSWHKKSYLCFSMLQLKGSWDKRMFFFFYKFLFLFLFLVMCLMSKFKKTEYNLICKVFTEVFLITRIPHSTVLITKVDVQRCSVWKVFLKILQNSLGNTCARVSFLIKIAGLVKFLRTSFLTEHLQRLLL